MNLREKRKIELKNQKEKRKERVVLAAIEIMKEKGIDNTKITDIAEKAEVGTASVYRYFKTKSELVIAAAIWLWDKEISLLKEQFYEKSYIELNGKEKVRRILNVFMTLYHEYPSFISFLEQFDNYIIKEDILPEKLEDYEKSIIDLKSIMLDAIEEGKKDGSIKYEVDNESFYMTITHSLMSLIQKLILRGNILAIDSKVNGSTQLKCLTDMAIDYISNI